VKISHNTPIGATPGMEFRDEDACLDRDQRGSAGELHTRREHHPSNAAPGTPRRARAMAAQIEIRDANSAAACTGGRHGLFIINRRDRKSR
jgi:hypothetical protein